MPELTRRFGAHRLAAAAGAGVFLLTFTAPLAGDDGRLEINQACAAVGCFPGDAADFPVTITAPGSYLLTGDLSATGTAVEVLSDHVTLDLNGFGLTGTDAADSWGVLLGADFIEIRNGYIRDFENGISPQDVADAEAAMAVSVSRVKVSSTVQAAIILGEHGSILDCVVLDNTGLAIFARNHGTVRGTLASNNGAGAPFLVDGILTGFDAVVRDNVAHNNTRDGISVTSGVVTGNTASENGHHGIRAGHPNADTSTVVTGNNVRSNGMNGLEVSANAVVSSNTSSENGESGIHLLRGGNLVIGNDVRSNQQYGIEISGATEEHLLKNNVAVGNNLSGGAFTNIDACGACTSIDNHAP